MPSQQRIGRRDKQSWHRTPVADGVGSRRAATLVSTACSPARFGTESIKASCRRRQRFICRLLQDERDGQWLA
jgi:hypothetical protein